jgi:hypothetical protein
MLSWQRDTSRQRLHCMHRFAFAVPHAWAHGLPVFITANIVVPVLSQRLRSPPTSEEPPAQRFPQGRGPLATGDGACTSHRASRAVWSY